MRAPLLAVSMLLGLSATGGAQPAPPPYEGGAGLGLALRRLGVTARVLYVTAHPDDENNAVLVRLARGEGIRTGLLTLTRGEGGQNAIGPELGFALGVLRTEELTEIHRYDGVEQFFGRAYEFGYSFSVDETFRKWGREESLGDVVRVVRAFRPDVILTLPLEASGGGQHHQAAAQLARDAFRAAADPARFPEQIAQGLRPWQALALYRSGVGGDSTSEGDAASVPIAVFDPLLGMSWTELGGLARRSHRSQDQGFGRGPRTLPPSRYVLVDSEPPLPSSHGILDGVDASLPGLMRFLHERDTPAAKALKARLEELQIGVGKAQAAFDSRSPERTASWLSVLLRMLRELPKDLPEEGPGHAEILDRLADEEGDVAQALALALGVRLEARARDDAVVPGQTFPVEVSLRNEGREAQPVSLALDVPEGWSAGTKDVVPAQLAAGAEARVLFDVTVAADAPLTRPYWHKAPDRDRMLIDRPQDETLPWSPPDVVATARFGIDAVTTRAPARWLGARSPGVEKRKLPAVVPALSVTLSPAVAVVPLARRTPRPFKATVTDFTRESGPASVRLVAPEGWTVTPKTREIVFRYEGEAVDAVFDVTPPARLTAGTQVVRAVVSRAGRDYGEGVQVVSYEHVQDRQLVREAAAQLVGVDVKAAPHARIGYVSGSGDGLAEALEQIGYPVTRLDADALAGDLDSFSTIVIGIRAFEVRADLRARAARLLEFARRGGHVVVQYNRAAFNFAGPPRPVADGANVVSPFVPYPAAVSSRRVSDENAPIEVLVPDHPVFNRPNRIGPQDWERWVQERAIQALDTRDARYRDLLTARDPFPENPDEQKGLLVEAPVGRGTWTYVGLVLFRQVAAGTPGGYRLLANLAGRPRS